MSAEEKTGLKLSELPHMSEDHLKVLEKHGITTPQKLLAVLKDKEKWDEIHHELKGIGPKTVEKWEELLKAEPGEKKEPEKKKAEPAPKKKAEKIEKKQEAPKKEAKKAGKKEKEEKEAEAEEEKEEVEIVEEGAYEAKKKPKLSAEIQYAMKKRIEIDDSRPEFYRQEYGRYQKLETGWRKPRGIHSKTRMKMRYRRPMVSVGYRGPKAARGLHPSGFEEVRVFNVNDLSKVSDSEKQAVRIGHTVGQRKRTLIIEKADELGIRVLNRGG